VVRVSDYGTILMKGGNSWEQKKLITHTLYIYIYIYYSRFNTLPS